jgi:PST family polysaccharide transporter
MLNSVVLPGVTAVIRNGGDFQVAVISGVGIVAWVAAPIAAFSIAFARPLILAIYGPQWGEAAPVLSVLSVYGMVFVLGLLFANIIIASGRTGVLFWVQAAALAALLPALPLGILWGGTVGAAWAHVLVVAGVTLPIYLISIRKVSGVRISAVIRQVMLPVLAAAASAALAVIATTGLDADATKTLAGFLIGGTAYALLTRRTLLSVFPVPAVFRVRIRRPAGKG